MLLDFLRSWFLLTIHAKLHVSPFSSMIRLMEKELENRGRERSFFSGIFAGIP